MVKVSIKWDRVLIIVSLWQRSRKPKPIDHIKYAALNYQLGQMMFRHYYRRDVEFFRNHCFGKRNLYLKSHEELDHMNRALKNRNQALK